MTIEALDRTGLWGACCRSGVRSKTCRRATWPTNGRWIAI
ncbi:[Protein-PII] uridylyltransferase domain protein [Mycobacterium ulcerans str. Harvey]|uniref:[Protein-PII] uridylyltransferase domain protein n=1 Tax=Mycobacterium ulcerans str. Harvey TaxID=1299332 RepID=A0ABN0QZM1_MYCUL|nr:[Protein-PII] uridylyltransferase domain protein [Mycobacterium ulcerans str. Harvey]